MIGWKGVFVHHGTLFVVKNVKLWASIGFCRIFAS